MPQGGRAFPICSQPYMDAARTFLSSRDFLFDASRMPTPSCFSCAFYHFPKSLCLCLQIRKPMIMAVTMRAMVSSTGQISRIHPTAVLMRKAASASIKAASSIRVMRFLGGSNNHHTSSAFSVPVTFVLYFGTGYPGMTISLSISFPHTSQPGCRRRAKSSR